MSVDDDVLSGHLQELRRGTVVVACLATLRTPGYGYALLETLAGAGSASTPTRSTRCCAGSRSRACSSREWNTDEARPRKFYRTSADGLELLATLRHDWRALDDRHHRPET